MTDLKKLKEHFFSDPMWVEVESMIREYMTPLESSLNIDVNLSNDQIATEVRGRQLAYQLLEKFLSDSGMLKPRIIREITQFK